MTFAPTITRINRHGEPVSVLLARPEPSEELYYQSYGFTLFEMYDYGDYVDTMPASEDHQPYGWAWVNGWGGMA